LLTAQLPGPTTMLSRAAAAVAAADVTGARDTTGFVLTTWLTRYSPPDNDIDLISAPVVGIVPELVERASGCDGIGQVHVLTSGRRLP